MSTTVLIIDDSVTVRQQVAHVLTQAGFTVAEARDGQDALERLGTLGDKVRVAICDVNMPRLGGLELLEKLKQMPQFSKLAVLMLTTEGQPESVARAKELGAKGWMVKPFDPTLLLRAVNKLAGS